MKNILVFLLLTMLASCEKEQLLCQNSPPVLRFSVMNTDSTIAFQPEKISISYLNKDNIRTEIGDVRKMKDIFATYDIVTKAHDLGNNTVFSLDADGIRIADILLKTYQDNTPCDGWIHASEVTANGKVLSINKTNYTYVIEVNAH